MTAGATANYSASYTPTKEGWFTAAVAAWCAIAVKTCANHGWACRIVDLTAGPGTWPSGPGSPPIVAAEIKRSGLDAEHICVERDPSHIPQLVAAVPGATVVVGDHRDWLLSEPRSGSLELVYFDGGGGDRVPVDELNAYLTAHPRADVLAHAAANSAYKRIADGIMLGEEYARIEKRFSALALPQLNAHQWVFYAGWNSAKVNLRRSFSYRGYEWWDSDDDLGGVLIREYSDTVGASPPRLGQGRLL